MPEHYSTIMTKNTLYDSNKEQSDYNFVCCGLLGSKDTEDSDNDTPDAK